MERTVATRDAEGRLVLDSQVCEALGLAPDEHIDFIIGDHGIRISTCASSRQVATPDLHDLWNREARIRALAGSLASEVDLVTELQAERRRESW